MKEPSKGTLEEIGLTIADHVYSVFQDLGIEQDFCVQCVTGNTVVFGGTNRFSFNPIDGLSADHESLTPHIREKWAKHNLNPFKGV